MGADASPDAGGGVNAWQFFTRLDKELPSATPLAGRRAWRSRAWDALDPARQDVLLFCAPEYLASTPGWPWELRDRANRMIAAYRPRGGIARADYAKLLDADLFTVQFDQNASVLVGRTDGSTTPIPEGTGRVWLHVAHHGGATEQVRALGAMGDAAGPAVVPILHGQTRWSPTLDVVLDDMRHEVAAARPPGGRFSLMVSAEPELMDELCHTLEQWRFHAGTDIALHLLPSTAGLGVRDEAVARAPTRGKPPRSRRSPAPWDPWSTEPLRPYPGTRPLPN